MHEPVFPNGCAICEVEVDPATGVFQITRYAAVDDVGRCINPMIVHGQTHGGIVQGVGQAIGELCALDPTSGQPVAASLMDYFMPRAADLPPFDPQRLNAAGSLFLTRPTLFDYIASVEELDATARDLFHVIASGAVTKDPLLDQVAAVSCGVHQDVAVLDLDYDEDSSAEADSNFVLTGDGNIVEIQATGEKRGFSQEEFEALFGLARKGIGELFEMQRKAVGL